ncbi:MAG TPA: polyprenyl diphosphate synthase [Bacilli bacterium]|nr:polyprenyl diphosphate synthase [Bacilli bacterium]
MSKTKITNYENYGIKHIAFILDGNGRWAKARKRPRTYGHEKGFSSLFDVGIAVSKRNIPFMSVYAFSTENRSRPKKEVDFLFRTLEKRLHSVLKKVQKHNIKIVTSGDLKRLPESTQQAINYAKEESKNNTGTTLNICINYGGKDEIVRAIKRLAADESVNIQALTPDTFENYLDTSGMPPVDLLVRTSGEMRLSNYMLWQLAYAEIIFTPTYWPDYDEECLVRDLEEYAKRTRRFGGL